MEKRRIVLASASPRRAQLLKDAGVEFTVLPVPVDETLDPELLSKPEEACGKLAERKAGAAVQVVIADPNYSGMCLVLGSDTMVVLDNVIFGKPTNVEHGASMLKALSGRTHQVMTSVSLWMISTNEAGEISVGFRTFVDVTDVAFKELTDEVILEYLKKGESFDKAGAYAIQGYGADLVERIDGAMDTVIGLPVERLMRDFPGLLK